MAEDMIVAKYKPIPQLKDLYQSYTNLTGGPFMSIGGNMGAGRDVAGKGTG